jgi:hypothetical protein
MPGVIYRTYAVQQYIEKSEKVVLPRFARPRMIIALWVLCGFLFSGLIVAWYTKIPHYIAGKAMVTETPNADTQAQTMYRCAIFTAPSAQQNVKIGQRIFIYLSSGRISGIISSIEPQIMSPDAIRHEFHNDDKAIMGYITQPVLVIYSQIDSIPGNLPLRAYLGSQCKAEIEIGSQRILTLVPFIGKFFTDQQKL